MVDAKEMRLRDESSSLLGMASGLSYMCCGASEELRGDEAGDFTDVVASLRHIATLIGEARGLMTESATGVPESVVRAHTVCTLVASDIAVESEGRCLQHWSDDITAWSLHALCDVIKRAKEAVDIPAVAAEEVAHG